MADIQQKSSGRDVGPVGAFVFGTDPVPSQLPTKSGWQQAGQALLQPHVLNNLYRGYEAPSIAPAQREATRHLRQEVMPQLAHEWGAGGSIGAFNRGTQGALGDLSSKLAALQYEKQFEMNKLRQEQLPKFQQLAQESNFQNMLTDKPINWAAGDRPENQRTMENRFKVSPAGQAMAEAGQGINRFGGQAARRIGTGVKGGVEAARNWLETPPRTQAELKTQQTQMKAAAAAAKNAPKVKSTDVPVPIADRIRQAYQAVEKFTRPPAAGERTAQNPTAILAQKKADKAYGKKGAVTPELAQSMETRHQRMIHNIKKMKKDVRSEFDKALPLMETTEQLEEFYKMAKSNPKRTKWQKFLDVMLPGFISKPLGVRGD